MAADVVAVLVVAAPSSPLLAPGRCGAMPPKVARSDHGGWYENSGPPGALALPLWWPSEAHPEGELVPEGWDRARRVWHGVPFGARLAAGVGHLTSVRLTDCADPPRKWCVELGEALVRAGLASRVVLLHRGPDGALVEMTP